MNMKREKIGRVRKCNVCVVGGAGFLGTHLVKCLIEERKCNVVVIDNLCAGKKDFLHPKAKFIHADITKSETFLKNVFSSYKIKYVFNYAAWPYIPDSFSRPLHVFDVNAVGAFYVMNAAQEAGCEAILQVSSAEIYGDSCDSKDKIKEDYKVNPHSTYGAAKAAIDHLVQVRWREAKTPAISLRQFNCVGEYDCLHPYVIPEIISQLKAHPPTVYLGNNSSRDFLYAGDAVRMAIELLEKGQFGEVYNCGAEDTIKIYDLAKLIGKIMNYPTIKIVTEKSRIRPWEIWSLRSDNSKIYSVIDYRPKVSLEEALRRTIQWIMENDGE